MSNQHPVVLVHGLFGFGPKEMGPLNYWGRAFKVSSALDRRYEASVGPVGSAHDRACELAAQIRGTRVDYGEDHSHEAGHARYGDDFAGSGFVPEWSEADPVHLVGHSHGAPTIRCLQYLLEQDYWGWGSNHRWVHSISAISGVLNGSTLVFQFGADEHTGLMSRTGLASVLLHIVELYTSATGGVVNLDDIYDFDLDHWGFQREEGESLKAYLGRVANSRLLWEKDNAAYSLTLQGAFQTNAIWRSFPETFYFSYVTENTWKDPITGKHNPSPMMLPEMQPPSLYIGHKVFDAPPIPVSNFDSADWWENDGLVSSYSQIYPHTAGEHPVGLEFDDETLEGPFEPGAWHYNFQRGMDHLDICLRPRLQAARQKAFYENLFARLAALPALSR